jgi:hypothetical protein
MTGKLLHEFPELARREFRTQENEIDREQLPFCFFCEAFEELLLAKRAISSLNFPANEKFI